MRQSGETAGGAPASPQLLDEGQADGKTLGDFCLGAVAFFERADDFLSEVMRVWVHGYILN